MQNSQCVPNLLANNSITQKVKRMTHGFVAPYLFLTNKDKLVTELKISGTWKKEYIVTAMFVSAWESEA